MLKAFVPCLLLLLRLSGIVVAGVGPDQPKVVAYGLVGLKNASTGLVPDDFKECEKRCVIEKKTDPNELLEEQRNAFNCRRDNRQMCEKKQCHLGYHCFVETKDAWREDIGHLFGRGLCRIGASNKAECDKKRHEHLEFKNTVLCIPN